MIKEYLLSIIPKSILIFLFPKKFGNELPMFVETFDTYANKKLKLFLREDSFIEKVIYNNGLYGNWEKESLKLWAALSKNATTIIDVGANTGIYSLVAQNNNAKAQIIAIEPIDINLNILSKNIKKNKFKIKTEKIALSDKEGTAKMYMLKDQLNYMTSINDDRYALHPEIKGDTEVVEIEVDIKPFNFIYEKYKLNTIDLIKIDVEGHEISVLNSMLPYLKEHKPSILIEIIGDENAKIMDEMFKTIGYEYVSIDEIHESIVVDKLWDNDHHNFLICDKKVINYLQSIQLVK